MFIVWGRKVVYRTLGHVADFCPMCRAAKAFRLSRVGSASHVYYLSAGAGELLGHERACHDCGTALQADATHYASVSKKLLPLPELIRTTYPRLEDAYGERLALEERIRRDPAALSQEERHVLIRNPFLLMSAKMERRFAQTHIDLGMGLALVGGLAAMLLGPALVLSVFPDIDALRLFTILLVVAAAALIWQARATRPRFVRRAVLPALATALRPLAPTQAELEAVVAELTHLKYETAKRIKVPELQERLAVAPHA